MIDTGGYSTLDHVISAGGGGGGGVIKLFRIFVVYVRM